MSAAEPKHRTLCVFSSSSNAVAAKYFAAATELGELIVRNRMVLIYGGGIIGLMGAVAKSVHRHGGRVVGVIPHYLRRKEIAYEAADELIVARDLRERKAIMESRADAFVALPGGFGTLEEVLEILTLKQLRRHPKPVVFLNTEGFFDPLLEMFERFYRERFANPEARRAYHLAARPAEVFAYLESYRSVDAGEAAP
ncbi:MAG: TIGR00730 family Rossman fold protein [Verrucomicrobia bacterium]|nr:TIGR00730 family Rossman fold protein [Verrucomicrobiota bacterium]